MKFNYSSLLSTATILSLFVLTACDKEKETLTATDSKDISEEAVLDAYYQDMDDLAAVAINSPTEDEFTGGRSAGTIIIEDSRVGCESVVIAIEPGANSTPGDPYGVLTIDFGTAGCADARGNVRKGKLIFAYDGLRFQPGSTVTTTTDNYSINRVRLEGSRVSTNITAGETGALKFNVVLTGGRATFLDNKVAEREADITWLWVRAENPAQDRVIILTNSTAGGVTREGRTYSVSLREQLEYERFCGMPVSGIKDYIIDGEKKITLDFGDGACDTALSVTIDGVTYPITIG